jgi:Protein of unknown function (DUF3617)
MAKLRTILVALGASALVAAAADAGTPLLNINTGLWQVTTTATVSGAAMPGLSQADLARLTPDQRAKFQAAMAAGLANAAKPHTIKSCMTEAKLEKDVAFSGDDSPNCKTTVVKHNNGSSISLKQVCVGDNPSVMTSDFVAKTRQSVVGKVQRVEGTGADQSSFVVNIAAQWVAADCGNVQ